MQLSFPEDDIAVITLDHPEKSANILSRSVLEELEGHLNTLESRDNLAGLILISAKPNMFIAGADLREFAASLDAPDDEIVAMCRRGQSLFARLTHLSGVTVAAIDGICVGGGAELACWCDRRIVSTNEKTAIGFPEVKLGLFPGWGGTVRLPRIIGLANAVEMITGGENIDAKEACKTGLASTATAADDLLAAAINLVRLEQQSGDYLIDRDSWRKAIDISETEMGFLAITADAVIKQQTKGHYPAPEKALEVMLQGAFVDEEAACVLEAENMAKLFGSPINAALLNVFFLTDRNKKDPGVEGEFELPKIASASIIGAGIMGAGIAAGNIRRDISVVITDVNRDAMIKGAESALDQAAYSRALKGPDVELAVAAGAMLTASQNDPEIAASDLIIEAVVENADIKRQVFERLEPLMNDDAILASNTSTIPITTLAESLAKPERFIGIHFFNPVPRMKLVEVIRGEKTSDVVTAAAVAYAKRLGKHPIVVNDGPGFLVNRLLFPYLHEAIELLLEGASIKDIDRAATSFGMPMGPITLYDLVGIDTAVFAGKVMAAAFPDRVTENDLLPSLVHADRLGKKKGLGFFSYLNRKKKAQPDPDFDAILKPHLREPREHTRESLQWRLFLPMLLEATRVIDEGIVRDVRDIDLGMIFGTGFPPFRGGLMFWADQVGAKELLARCNEFAAVGDRFIATPLLEKLAASDGKFYDLK